MSACNGFSPCRIQFTPNDEQRAARNYSDRSIIELRQYDFANYSLRALDIENNRDEIFNIPLENEDQYKCGKSKDFPDEIRGNSGTYRLWLNAASRTKFHDVLNLAVQELKLLDPESFPTLTNAASTPNPRHDNARARSNSSDDDDDHKKPNTRIDRKPPRADSPDDRVQQKPNTHVNRKPPRADSPDDDDHKKPNKRVDRKPPRADSPDDYVQQKPNSRVDRKPPRADSPDDHVQQKPNSRVDRKPPRPNSSDDDDDHKKSNTRVDRKPPRADSPDDRIQQKPNTRVDRKPPRANSPDDHDQQRSSSRNNREQPKPKAQPNRNDILADVYQLGQHIRQGHTDDAVTLAKKLSQKHVQLQGNLRKQQDEENSIQIRVKIDSNDQRVTKKYGELTMDVYPSTTIRELRTAFEYTEKFSPANQYFFVNGHLAHENFTMKELDVHPDLLFVLFVIDQ